MEPGSGTGRPHSRTSRRARATRGLHAAPPSDAAAAAGGADASSPSPAPAAPVDRPQGRAREQGTHGSSSAAAAGPDQKGKGLAAVPSVASPPPRCAGSSPSTPTSSPDGALPPGAIDSKKVFEQLVRDQRAINEEEEDERRKKKNKTEQVKSSHAKKALWSSKRKIIDRDKRKIYSQHVGRKTRPISQVGNYYRVAKDMPIRVNFNAYLRFRPVYGDGECFYRSFIFSYLEQVLDRQDTHEEHRLLDTVKRVSAQYTNLGWTSEFWRSCKAFEKLIKDVMGWKRQSRWNNVLSTNSYRKEKLLEFFSTYDTTEDILVFLRLAVAIQICSNGNEYTQIIDELNEGYSLKDWCFERVTPPREFTDHVMMAALGTALEVPLRVERLHGAGGALDIYNGPGVVSVTLLYTGNHYDILYPPAPPADS